MTDIIKVQEDIARSIATNLEIRLTTLAAEGFAARGSSSLQAYQLYLTAHYHYELATRTDNERAIELFRQAVAADGNFAPAYIGLARAYLNQESLGNRAIKDIAADAGPHLDRAEKLPQPGRGAALRACGPRRTRVPALPICYEVGPSLLRKMDPIRQPENSHDQPIAIAPDRGPAARLRHRRLLRSLHQGIGAR